MGLLPACAQVGALIADLYENTALRKPRTPPTMPATEQ